MIKEKSWFEALGLKPKRKKKLPPKEAREEERAEHALLEAFSGRYPNRVDKRFAVHRGWLDEHSRITRKGLDRLTRQGHMCGLRARYAPNICKFHNRDEKVIKRLW